MVSSGAPPRATTPGTRSGIPWWPEARGPGRDTGRLDLDRICAVALEILDEEGYDALSMRRLANALDAGTMTIYWHVATKDELLAHVVDLVMSAVEPPDENDNWVAQLREVAWNTRRALSAHPEIARVVLQGVMAGPGLLRLQENVLAILRGAGFDEPTAIDAFYAIGLVFTASLTNPVARPPESASIERARWSAGHSQRHLDRDMYPTIVELADGLEAPADESRFEFALETVLAGLEHQHPLRATRST